MRFSRLIVFALLCIPAVAEAQPSASRVPSNAFRDKALALLRSQPTVAAARWEDVLKSRPQGLLGAIAAAEQKGWQPTAGTLYASKGKPKGTAPAFQPVALKQDWYGSWGAEMLIWEWEDGDETTVEGTVWIHSYSTNSYATFNVQLAGETYSELYETYDETFDAAYNDPTTFGNAPAPAPALDRDIVPAPGIGFMLRKAGLAAPPQREKCEFTARMCEQSETQALNNRCNYEAGHAGAGCWWRENARRYREGIVGFFTETGLGMAAGWRNCPGHMGRRLACVVTGAAIDGGADAAGQIAQMFADQWDARCRDEARNQYDSCMSGGIDISICMWSRGCSPAPQAAPSPALKPMAPVILMR